MPAASRDVGQPNAYMLDKTNGANLLTIAIGHSLDTLSYVLGESADLTAVSGLRRPLITIEETGEQIVKTAADQIAVIGTLSGATASVHIREAVAGGTGFPFWEVNGTDGTLRITADAAQPQIFPLTIFGSTRAERAHRTCCPVSTGPEMAHSYQPGRNPPPTTLGVPTQRSRRTSTTGLTPCRTSRRLSGATRSSLPSKDPWPRGST